MSRVIGQIKEKEALIYLKAKGLKPIARNFNTRMGEIDLIMKDKEYIVFVEVRYRKTSEYGSGLESITYGKQEKIKRTATYYLQKNSLYDKVYCRFDVISLSTGGEVDWIRNAF